MCIQVWCAGSSQGSHTGNGVYHVLLEPMTPASLSPTHGRLILAAVNKLAHPVCLSHHLHFLVLFLEIDACLVLR